MTALPSPRNPWHRLRRALELGEGGAVHAARRIVEGLRHNPEVAPDIRAIYERLIEAAARAHGRTGAIRPVDTPADFLGDASGLLPLPFRRLREGADLPRPYPYGMALPDLIGERNDTGFLRTAAVALAGQAPLTIREVHVVQAGGMADPDRLMRALAAQRFDGRIALTLFDRPDGPAPEGAAALAEPLLSAAGRARLAEIASTADLVIFLSGTADPDPLFAERAAQLARVSENVAQPLVAAPPRDGLRSLFSTDAPAGAFQSRYPFRELAGLNLAVPRALLERAGLPDIRFESLHFAGLELAFRLMNKGAYLAALPVPGLVPVPGPVPEAAAEEPCRQLYRALCPNHWDRKTDGHFEVPRISVYIPAYNAARYLQRAIDSVLEQDVADLEVCVADDGSTDATAELLERHYGAEPRLRWESGRNGGIGHASNRAIGLARGLYIGQLDSDDRLKPGAVRRLAEYLDDHPKVVCCYGSCERIDAGGAYVRDEYSWPVFSREKMMITSIAHHFRMFRRAAWERTQRFREDIANAVDYDIFLKLSETGHFHHVEEMLYQRRWHGENTSDRNEGHQTANTYRVQREALARQGLARFWEVHVPDPAEPRRVTYRRRGTPMVLFWPDYSRSNPYQKLLYGKARGRIEICAGRIEAALRLLEEGDAAPGDVTFHLHWLNFLFAEAADAVAARQAVTDFLDRLAQFHDRGGRAIWTIHNTVSHDSPYRDLEIELSRRLTELADGLHLHSAASVAEVARIFPVPAEKLLISRHGHYIGAYPDYITRADARRELGIAGDDDVILFTGQVRPYKGVEDLLAVFRRILAERPGALLLVAGQMRFDPRAGLRPGLSTAEAARIRFSERFVTDEELQVFCRAADIAVYPYRHILTSGSLLLAMSFGLPAVVPDVGMTREVLADRDAGVLYDAERGAAGLEAALRQMLARKDAGELENMGRNARKAAEGMDWPDFSKICPTGPLSTLI